MVLDQLVTTKKYLARSVLCCALADRKKEKDGRLRVPLLIKWTDRGVFVCVCVVFLCVFVRAYER